MNRGYAHPYMSNQKKLSDLKPNIKNPRKSTDSKLAMLKKSLDKFGDLGCIVFNKKTGQLVGGHQRNKTFEPTTDIVITQSYDPPTRTGTVAEGYFVIAGDKFKYREVFWDEETEKAAMISANKQGGEWDNPLLADLVSELSQNEYDMQLLGYEIPEIESLITTYVRGHERTLPGENGENAAEIKEKELDENIETNHECPSCGYTW